MNAGQLTAVGSFALTATDAPQGSTTSTLLNNAQVTQGYSPQMALTYGTTSGKVNLLVCQSRLLAASASEELDLYDGTVLDVFGEAAAFRTLRYIMVFLTDNADASTGATSITVGGAATDPTSLWFGATNDVQLVYSGGVPFQQGSLAGVVIGASTNHVKVLNNDGTNKATYILVLAGSTV